MSIQFELYEGDSIPRLSRLFALPGQAPVGHQRPPRSLWTVIGEAIERAFDRLEAGEQRRRYREIENYLADSGDVYELERRICRLQRRQGAGFNSDF